MSHITQVTILLGKILLLVSIASAQVSHASPKDQVKAQFIYNFANYVEWPTDAFTTEAKLKICLLGTLSFAPYLKAFDGALVGGQELTVFEANDLGDIAKGCHILYVSQQAEVELPNLWDKIEYMYVLSVGNRSEFTDKGGIINIFRTSDHVGFDININNALTNGLFLDSDLLSLARTIKRHTKNR